MQKSSILLYYVTFLTCQTLFYEIHCLSSRIAHWWFPRLKRTVVYSDILDEYMSVSVTERTLKLIDQHAGFDSYILEVSKSQR